ncbi:unnamed protein product [Gadus morhua 'NCC']
MPEVSNAHRERTSANPSVIRVSMEEFSRRTAAAPPWSPGWKRSEQSLLCNCSRLSLCLYPRCPLAAVYLTLLSCWDSLSFSYYLSSSQVTSLELLDAMEMLLQHLIYTLARNTTSPAPEKRAIHQPLLVGRAEVKRQERGSTREDQCDTTGSAWDSNTTAAGGGGASPQPALNQKEL